MPLVGMLQPPLTTVAIPQHEIGVQAARLLLDRLGDQRPGPERRLLATELVVRGSTAAPRRRSGVQSDGGAV
jgi:LacI family transcriptional regulator